MAILTVAQINDICIEVANSSTGIHEFSSQYFNLALPFGFRDIEMCEKSRWTPINETQFEVETAKGSNDRVIEQADVPPILRAFYLGTSSYENLKSARQLRRVFKMFAPSGTLLVGSKGVSVYLYRYNICKQLFHVQSWTVQQISDFIGEVNNTNTLKYIDAKVELIT